MQSRAFLCLFAVVAVYGQQAGEQAVPDKPAALEGSVTHATTGEPLPRVHVTLRGNANGTQRQYGAMTTADGKFSVTGIAPGAYTITAERVGFTMPSGPPGFTGASLKADERKTDFKLKLLPTGSLTGRVVDSEGEPVEGANVIAEGGGNSESSASDEKGMFRIGGLAPGRYRVKASRNSQTPFGREVRTDGSVEVRNAMTYYPGVLSAKEAGRVDVRSDGDTGGVNITLVKVPWVRVSGRVVGEFRASDRIYITAQRDGGFQPGQMIPGASAKPDGSFEMWRLDPGRYQITGGWNGPGGQYVRTAAASVEVAGSNIDGVELNVVPPFDLAGRLEYETDEAKALPQAQQASQGANTQQPPPKPRRTIMLREVSTGFTTNAPAQVQDDDTFQFPKMAAGKYRVIASWNTVYVKSTRVGSVVADGAILDLSRGAGGELSLMLGAANASVTGTVEDEQEKPAGSIVILALSTDDSSLTPRTALIKADGTYTFNNVAPGSYRIVAVQRNDMVPVQRAGGLLDYEDLMEAVEVHSGDKITKDLKRRVPGSPR